MFDDTKVVFRMEEGHTIQWSKDKGRKDTQWSIRTKHDNEN